jgi:two-component system, NtrC family, sensor kinase
MEKSMRKKQEAAEVQPTVDITASEGWLHGLVDQTLAGIYLIQDGYFRYVNRGFADIFGYASPVDIIDKVMISQLIAPEDRQKVADNVRRRTEGDVQEIRYTFVGLRKDGSRINVEVHGRNMQFKGKTAVIGLVLDITERKLAEAASDEKLRGLFELSPLGIALTDMQGRYIEFNEAFCRICGYPADELRTLDYWTLTPKRFEADEARQLKSLELTGRYGPYEKEFQRKDGSLVPVQLSGMLLTGSDGGKYIWSIVEDISARKQGELALQDSLHFARQLVEVIPSPVFYKDSQGRYLGCNEAFERFLGKQRQDIVGKSVYDLSPKELADRYHAADLPLLEHVGTQFYEASVRSADGSLHDVVFHKATFAKADGSIGGLVGVILDITERKRLESEMAKRIEELKALNTRLAEAQTQLLQAEKLAAVGQLAAGIAHEINNPVGFINSNLGSLKKYTTSFLQLIDAYRLVAEVCPPEHPALLRVNQLCDEIDINFIRDDALSLLGESREGLERIKHIVADLRDFSRIGETKWQQADVHKCLDSTLNVISSEITTRTSIVKKYGVLPEIRCMPFQLNQVFMNLLLNAAHAIKEHGTITLRTGREAETVWIDVEDSGMGISAENLKRIFEPFFTTKAVGAGTGLGLSVAYGIVQQHQGRIEVRSEPGKGTVFRVILPINPLPVNDMPNVISP